MKRKAGLTSDRDGAQRDKEIGRGPQRKTNNGPRKGVEASEIAWVHLSPSGDDSISLNGSVMESSTAQLRPCGPRANSAQAEEPTKPQRPNLQSSSAQEGLSPRSLVAQFDELSYSTQAMQPNSQFSSGYSAHKASTPGA